MQQRMHATSGADLPLLATMTMCLPRQSSRVRASRSEHSPSSISASSAGMCSVSLSRWPDAKSRLLRMSMASTGPALRAPVGLIAIFADAGLFTWLSYLIPMPKKHIPAGNGRKCVLVSAFVSAFTAQPSFAGFAGVAGVAAVIKQVLSW